MKHFSHSFIFAIFLFPSLKSHAQLPDHFVDQVILGGLNEVIGVDFDTTGRMYIWEKGGIVRIYENDSLLSDPLIDISEETGNFGDHGLLGFAIHPDFYANGYFYLYYTVDRHYLLNYGKVTYSPTSNDYYNATICRLTRYTADASTNFTTVIPGSRTILIGSTKKNGVAIMHDSHAGSPLIFATDKTLLVLTGDGASYNEADNGSKADTYYLNGLADTIIRQKENIGAYRSQLLDCLNGKILRIDPETGNGIPSNPYYNAASPGSIKSKVWGLGLRNPFRAELKPGTGSTNPADANPGILYIGDVGWNDWEELNICDASAQNFGWPVFEGMEMQIGYDANSADNRDATNPLFDGSTCTDKFFDFKNLIVQETLLPSPNYPNPCNPLINIPSAFNLYQNKRPILDWAHDVVETRVSTFTGTTANWEHIHDAIDGEDFSGAASVGGVWYTGSAYPIEFQNTYFHADFAGNWIKNIHLTTDDELISVDDFFDAPGPVVCMDMNPVDGYIYYVQYPSQVKRFAYVGGSNLVPEAIIETDVIYGTSPLTVNFSADSSADPEGGTLNYLWDFGDGTTSTIKNPSHTFTTLDSEPTPFTITLTVTDSLDLSATAGIIISLNNTPPVP
ncbi:MAG: PQQ-dependent sugar dehydrogenase, partial [Fimbriimonadaceae bacterium]|nr:PQQ-dependent sugar dehydrogenase [Chitinophagales bacterium]